MASGTGRASSSHPQGAVRADTLGQVEPDHGGEFVLRPYSLTAAELGGLPASIASEPTPVLAWVRYAPIAKRVRGLALAWTPRAVYVEWEDRGTHRAWVWASAVERAPAPDAATDAHLRPRETIVTALSSKRLVELVNAQLAHIGCEFVTAMAKPSGPFSAVVFGSIDGHHVRLDFLNEPTTDRCAVLLFDMSRKEILSDRGAAPTFEEAIMTYPWATAIDALALDWTDER